MWSFLRGEPDVIVTNGPRLIVGGCALVGMSILFDSDGIIAGTFAVGLGAAGMRLATWRIERGVWMLALVFLSMNLFIYACFLLGQFRDFQRGVRPESFALMGDLSLGTLFLAVNSRFLWQVVTKNYTLSHIHERE